MNKKNTARKNRKPSKINTKQQRKRLLKAARYYKHMCTRSHSLRNGSAVQPTEIQAYRNRGEATNDCVKTE